MFRGSARLWLLGTCLSLALGGTLGCRLLAAPFLLWGKPPTKDVPAEYPYLADKKVCVVVWAELDTLYEYPNVQLEVAEHIRAALEAKVDGVTFIPSRQVVDLQRQDPDWDRTDPAALGARFGADRVLVVELTQYRTRDPDSPHLFRGRISAGIKVYDTAYRDAAPSYSTVVETAYPPDSPGTWGTNDSAIRWATMEAFAADVATQFYDRKVEVK